MDENIELGEINEGADSEEEAADDDAIEETNLIVEDDDLIGEDDDHASWLLMRASQSLTDPTPMQLAQHLMKDY